jgi:hypothetical protein
MSFWRRLLRRLVPVARWVRANEYSLMIGGASLFVLALITGIFWLVGSDVEPLAFVLGMLSSLCFAAPSVANYILPKRKPVSLMSHPELLSFIPTTDATSDWDGVATDEASERFLKEDPRLRYRAKFTDDGVQNPDIVEEWANRHPNPTAVGYWYELLYDGALIDRCVLVSVDGGRALLPLPNRRTQTISRYHYVVARIHDHFHTLDQYLERCCITVESTREPTDLDGT